jgi:hypothetical protein
MREDMQTLNSDEKRTLQPEITRKHVDIDYIIAVMRKYKQLHSYVQLITKVFNLSVQHLL